MAMYRFPNSDGVIRRFADVEITNLITGAAKSAFSLSVATLRGVHPPTVSRLSERAYYIVEGSLMFTVATEKFKVGAGDAVLVPKGATHAMEGTAQYVVVNAPPFDAAAEDAAS
ncbi:cupin domain-containing protein [Streptomyces sp. NPDC006365]|uniref:cupin domain-containing protein n=1 Tax=Streptomyces sp. NPDC006365 TaxID=3364744 RepID=UPI0036A7C721